MSDPDRAPAAAAGDELVIVYDGECPFCSRYVMLYRIRDHIPKISLIDAREASPVVEEIRALGLDLDQGMAVKWNGTLYHGPEAMHLLAMLGSDSGLFNRFNRLLFRHPGVARRVYPLLVAGRRATLWLLGRSKIANLQT